jgi:hypothetical protein
VAEARAQELFAISLGQAEEAVASADRLPLPRNKDVVLDASKALRKASCTPRGGGTAVFPLLCTTGLAASVALHAPAASAFSSRRALGLSLAGRIGAKVQGKRLFSVEFAQNVVPASASDWAKNVEHIAGSNMVVSLAAPPSEGGFGCAEEVIPSATVEGQENLGEGSNMYALLSRMAFYCLPNASSLMDSYLVELARSQQQESAQIVELPRPKSCVAGFESTNAQLPNLARGAVTMQSGTMGGGRSLVLGVGTWKQFFYPGAKVMGEAYAICFGGQLPKVTLAVFEGYLGAWEKEGFPVSFKQRFPRESGDDDEDKSEYPIFVANFSSEADVDLAVAFLKREGNEKN